ncbi:hypothetical protein B296_00011276 [Ensete ventricosum]|uniref:Uncharacterized protein n=1 Tax=Ensete ventricosum TaxID=4639 RepID=A0A426XRQ3_ENSVE|nr:hypothetical protein B296_00011276 [Ensete ventricosum]
MGLATPWYRKGGTSMESSIPCSHGGRALVVKGVEEVKNAKANSKYQDRAEGQRPRNFIRPLSMDFSSRELKARDFGLMQECSTKERSRQYAVLYLFYSEESFPSSEGSTRTNKDQYNLANPTQDSVISELKQYGGSEFDYSTSAAKSGGEPKGHVTAKAKD